MVHFGKDNLISFASRRTANSYAVEAFIPSSLVPAWYPLPGKIIGFNYSLFPSVLEYLKSILQCSTFFQTLAEKTLIFRPFRFMLVRNPRETLI